MTTNFGFFITSMPDSRPADYYLGCLDGSVFLDFNNQDKDRISLKRISFDGYGCCELGDKVTPLDADDSRSFKTIIKNNLKDYDLLLTIVKKAIALNRQDIWADALEEYDLNLDNRTEEILTRFDKSWTETEKRFDDLINNYSGFDRLKPVRQFISELKQKGEDKYFRLGTSMHTLIISRSVNFGLRTDQKHIKIEAFDNKFEVIFRDGEKNYREYMVDNLNDARVTKLLQTLKDTLLD